MWYNIYIMKKYCLFIILSAIFLCGCEEEKPPEYVYHNHTPLTVVTTATTVPADTYSEYMETYTPPSTTGTDVYYYHLSPTYDREGNLPGNFHIDIPPMDKPQLDTAARPEKAARPDVSSDDGTTAVTTVPENRETEETSTASPAFTIQLPETDAVHHQTAPKDTAPTEFVPETTEAELSTE
ncbi:MAG: hypothetical protein IJ035_00035 [Oscillospiraceae bacterium]|nr:hypothetical protein [Oscillospiraceae bacterium]